MRRTESSSTVRRSAPAADSSPQRVGIGFRCTVRLKPDTTDAIVHAGRCKVTVSTPVVSGFSRTSAKQIPPFISAGGVRPAARRDRRRRIREADRLVAHSR